MGDGALGALDSDERGRPNTDVRWTDARYARRGTRTILLSHPLAPICPAVGDSRRSFVDRRSTARYACTGGGYDRGSSRGHARRAAGRRRPACRRTRQSRLGRRPDLGERHGRSRVGVHLRRRGVRRTPRRRRRRARPRHRSRADRLRLPYRPVGRRRQRDVGRVERLSHGVGGALPRRRRREFRPRHGRGPLLVRRVGERGILPREAHHRPGERRRERLPKSDDRERVRSDPARRARAVGNAPRPRGRERLARRRRRPRPPSMRASTKT